MIRTTISCLGIISTLLPVCASAQASPLGDDEWPSWVDCVEWLDASCPVVSGQEATPSIPNIPERYRPIYYDRMTGELVQPSSAEPSASVSDFTSQETPTDWPDWIGVPEWYQ